MRAFTKNLIAEWRRADLPMDARLVVGVSGGADSCALAGALVELREASKITNEIVIAHFDHGLRGTDSDADRNFVECLAESFGCEYRSGAAALDEISGNIEQSARRARYRYLEKTAAATGSRFVLTGHTTNDQAETLLMNLLRGAGAKGLSAMSVKRRLSAAGEIDLVRPLLTWATREMTENYCREAEISFRSDVMNEDARFTRVRIRKELLPQLEEFNPNIINVLCQTASNIADMRGVFEYLLNENPGISAMIGNGYLPVRDLNRCPSELKRAVVKAWLRKQIGNAKRISAANIRSVVLLSESKKSGKTVELPNGLSVIKSGGKLKLHKALVEKTHTEDYN